MLLPETLCHIKEKLQNSGNENATAGVAAIFRVNNNRLEILLVKRTVVTGDPWSGDMAFPGGKRTQQDKTIYDTVKREVFEETNINLDRGHYLGMMSPEFSTVRPNMAVIPFLFLFDESFVITINEELDSYYWTEFSKLKWRRGRSIVKKLDVPVYDIGEERVWGLTYRILNKMIALAEC